MKPGARDFKKFYYIMFKTILSDIFLWVLNLFSFEIIYIDKIRIFGAEAPRMEEKNSFAQLLEKNRIPIERYIHYRIPVSYTHLDVYKRQGPYCP